MNVRQWFVLLVGLVLGMANAPADKAIFAGGCFRCMESDFEKLEGVTDVVSGFTGGKLQNLTYNGDHTRHYEAEAWPRCWMLVPSRDLGGAAVG